jgi:hypothetical protein
VTISHAYGGAQKPDWHVEYRVRVPFTHNGRVFREGDLVRESDLPVGEILSKRPDLLFVHAGIRRTTDTWREM